MALRATVEKVSNVSTGIATPSLTQECCDVKDFHQPFFSCSACEGDAVLLSVWLMFLAYCGRHAHIFMNTEAAPSSSRELLNWSHRSVKTIVTAGAACDIFPHTKCRWQHPSSCHFVVLHPFLFQCFHSLAKVASLLCHTKVLLHASQSILRYKVKSLKCKIMATCGPWFHQLYFLLAFFWDSMYKTRYKATWSPVQDRLWGDM